MNAISKLKNRISPSSKNKKSIKKLGYETLELDQVKKGTPFVDLFPINPETLKSITDDMKVNGFDTSQPIIIWKQTNVLIDGHTRCEAARKAGLKEVVVIYEDFEDTDAALKYAYSLQFSRRNLNDADKFSFSETYITNVGAGPKKSGRKSKELAEILSVSTGTAQKYISVILRGSAKTKRSVRLGMMTINSAYKSLLHKEQTSNSKPVKSSKYRKKSKGNQHTKSKENSNKEVVQIDLKLIEEKIDSWVYKIGSKEGNSFPYKERLQAVYEILPADSYLKEYTQKLIDGGNKNECV